MRVAVDVGGTFTDLVATGAGETIALKVATTPRAPEAGVLAAFETLAERGVNLGAVERIVHATTIATNALLGQMHLELPRVVFVTTEGFRDVIEIGRQNRSAVYDLFVTRPKPLVAREDRIVARERMNYRGEAVVVLDDAEITRVVAAVVACKPGAIAIGFLHAYANDAHERRIEAALAQALPDVPITRSSAVDPAYREYERFSTTVINAALLPIVRRYLDDLRAALIARGITAPLYVMRSDGGMTRAELAAALPASLIESGPAGGAIATAALARDLQITHALSFDMGGTTAKAGTITDGVVQLATEFEAAGGTHSGRTVKGSGYPVRFPFVDLAEISAGGGTIAYIDDGGSLRVGPLSAGADPGPACYGNGGDATVTDANVVLGRLHQTHLLGGAFAIDASRSHAAIARLAERIGISIEATAAGIVTLIDAQMAKVLRIVTVERGLDPRDFALVAFGGNGALHACALAEDLGIRRIFVPQRPGLFSADGLLAADLRASASAPLMHDTDTLPAGIFDRAFAPLEARVRDEVVAQGAREDALHIVREADARYRGQSFELTVAIDGGPLDAAEAFHREHERRYGYAVRDETVELINLRAIGTATFGASPASSAAGETASDHSRAVYLEGGYREIPLHRRDALVAQRIEGPALIEQYDAVTYVAPGWNATVREGVLEMTS